MRPLQNYFLIFLTLLGATAGALLFQALQLPLAYILGSLVGSAFVANVIRPMQGAQHLRRVGQLVVGAAIGGVLSSEVIVELARLLPLMIAAAVSANVVGALLSIPVSKIAGVSRLTGLLACLPAGMAEMSLLARDLGAHEQTVALVQTLRVVLIVTFLPLWLGLAGKSPMPAPPPAGLIEAFNMTAVLGIGAILAAALSRLGVLNPWVISPMLVCLSAVAAGLTVPHLPGPVFIGAQIAIGAALGIRFLLQDLRTMPRAALAGIASSLVLVGVSLVGVATVVQLGSGVGNETAVLAVMPGGLGEMIAAATTLASLPATVAGFHITRSVLTNMVTPPIIKAVLRRRSGGGSSG